MDGMASCATGCYKNTALGVEALGVCDPVLVKTQDLPLDQIPDRGVGASHSGTSVVDVGTPGFCDLPLVQDRDRRPDEIPDSDHRASLAITNYIMATDQAAPPRTGQADGHACARLWQ
ncbi:MAG: hypothetical protein ACKPKO_03955, partial [Candidatus Fonsibacter sp.]